METSVKKKTKEEKTVAKVSIKKTLSSDRKEVHLQHATGG